MSFLSQLLGADASKNASKYGAMTDVQIQSLLKQAQALDPTNQLVSMASTTPYSGYTGPDPYGDDAQTAAYSLYGEDYGRGADSAVSSLTNDYANRGIVGGTGINQGISRIRATQGSELGKYRSQLRERGALAKQAQYKDAEDTRWQRLQANLATMLQSQGIALNGIGGQQSLAASQAGAQGGLIGSVLGKLINPIGSLTGAGNNRTGTNQVGSNPFQPPVPIDQFQLGGPSYGD